MAIEIKSWEGYRVIWLRMEAGPGWGDHLQHAGRLNGKQLAMVALGVEHNQFNHFVAAVWQAILESIGDGDGSRFPFESLSEASSWLDLINLISELADPLVLVLTGYELIESMAVHEAVSELLEYQPETLQIILFCRTNPPLPLPRLRARRVLLEVAQDEISAGVEGD